MPEPVLAVDGLAKTYATTPALEGLTFSLAPGEILALVGPNGAGKTTTMRCVAGIIPATRGSVRVAGFDAVADPVAAKSRLAYVPDDPKLFDSLTVWEHLDFVAAAYRVPEWRPRAEALLARFELAAERDKPASDLSRGMRQKVAICCAYLHDPVLVMMDEPLTGLDPHGIRTMKQTIRERAAAGGGVVISSHLLALVEDLCTGLLILHKGRRVFFGAIEEARRTFAHDLADASLEEVFFRATEGAAPAPAARDAGSGGMQPGGMGL